jgi:hypothetical protein
MNLMQVLHERWAADTTLNGLLPVASVFTGIHFAEDPVFPYATLTRPGDVPETFTNSGDAVENVSVRITTYHDADSYDAGLAIAEAVQDLYNRTKFDLSGNDKVLSMTRAGYQEIPEPENGDWFFVVDFTCLVYLATGS